jgi:DNA-binding NarL/FixJ family response regulator/signal transduction histidine kinase
MESKRWQWIDWSLFYLHLFWYVSISLFLLKNINEYVPELHWLTFVLFTLSFAVPQFFWRPSYRNAVYFTLAELGFGGLITGLLYVFKDNFTDNMSIPMIILGYLATKRVAYWSAPLLIIGLPLLGVILGHQTWGMTMDTLFNHLLLYGVGAGYNIFILINSKMKALLSENQKQYQLIQQYANQVEAMTLKEERSRLAGELHDTVGYAFTSLIMGLEVSKALMEIDTDQAKVKMEGILRQARMSIDDIRHQIHQITPLEMDLAFSNYIIREMKLFTENTHVQVNIELVGEEIQVPEQIRFVLIRCLQEALTNAVKHGQVSQVEIRLCYEANKLIFSIKDEGVGTSDLTYGFDLRTMEQRLTTVAGKLKLNSRLNVGTEIICEIPLKDQQLNQQEIQPLIIDDQELIRESLQIIFMREADIEVVALGKNGLEAIELCDKLQPHVVLIDVSMPEMDGVQATKQIKQQWPEIKVIILTTFQETDSAMEAISLGAEGYLLKTIHPLDLLSAIRLVYRGGTLISTEVAGQLIDLLKQWSETKNELKLKEPFKDIKIDSYGLTERELQVLECLSEGDKYRDIANKLFLSEGTVRNYVSSLYSKLEVNNRMQAMKKAQLHGLV